MHFHPIPVTALMHLAKVQSVGVLFMIVTINNKFYPYKADQIGCLSERYCVH